MSLGPWAQVSWQSVALSHLPLLIRLKVMISGYTGHVRLKVSTCEAVGAPAGSDSGSQCISDLELLLKPFGASN